MGALTLKNNQEMKKLIIETALNYVTNNQIDMHKFRIQEKSIYTRLHYYFGSISLFKQELFNLHGIIPASNNFSYNSSSPNYKKVDHSKSVRNKLAYEYLDALLSELTYDEVATIYGVTRQAIHNLYESLSKSLGRKEDVNG